MISRHEDRASPPHARERPDEADNARRARRIDGALLLCWVVMAWGAFGYWMFTLALAVRSPFESLLRALENN